MTCRGPHPVPDLNPEMAIMTAALLNNTRWFPPPSPHSITFRTLLKTVAVWIDLLYILWVSPQSANFRLASGPYGVEKQVSYEAEQLAFLFQGLACSSGKNCGPLPNPWVGEFIVLSLVQFQSCCVEPVVSSSRIPGTCFLSSPEHLLRLKPLRDSKLFKD